jgi:hypothetical protein
VIILANQRVDKLSLSRTYRTLEERDEYNTALGQAMLLSEQGDLQRFKKTYETAFWKQYPSEQKPTVYFRFGGNHKFTWSRIDFTPDKLTMNDWIDFIYICGLLHGDSNYGEPLPVWTRFKVSEIELARDIRAQMEDFIYLAPGFTLYNDKYRAKGSQYIGGKKSLLRFTAYDKQKQLIEKKGIYIDYPLTRIEARIKGTNLTMSELASLPPPYRKLLMVPTEKLVHLGNNKAEKFFIHYINQGMTGHEAYLKLNKDQRKQIRTALQLHRLKLWEDPKWWEEWLQNKVNDWYKRFHADV